MPDAPLKTTSGMSPAARDLLDLLAATVAGLAAERMTVRLRWPNSVSSRSGPDVAEEITRLMATLDAEDANAR